MWYWPGAGEWMDDIGYLLIKREKKESQEMAFEKKKEHFYKIEILHNKNPCVKKIQRWVPAGRKYSSVKSCSIESKWLQEMTSDTQKRKISDQ